MSRIAQQTHTTFKFIYFCHGDTHTAAIIKCMDEGPMKTNWIHTHTRTFTASICIFAAIRHATGWLDSWTSYTVNNGRQKIIKELTCSSWGWFCSRFPQQMEAGWRGEAEGRWPRHEASAAHPSARTWTSSRAWLQPSRAAASNSSAPSLTLTGPWKAGHEDLVH
jgi:hypothetical protein